MVSDGLRALVTRGEGVGELAGDGVVTGASEHPVCGDRMQLSVRLDGDVIREVRWRASGCPASMALAALCAAALRDVEVAQLESVLRREVAARGGLQRHERHAEAMALRALRAAVGG